MTSASNASNMQTSNKLVGTGNGVAVTLGSVNDTTYVSTSGYGITEPTTTDSGLQNAAFATVDEYQAAQTHQFAPFDAQWAYEGTDLGATYSSTGTTFKVWSPTATSVKLLSYGTSTSPTAALVNSYSMTRGTSATPSSHATNNIGVWSYTLSGDDAGTVYQYQLTFADGTVSDYYQVSGQPAYGTYTASSVTNTTQDPYATAVVQGGMRSVVESPASMTPSGFSVKQGSTATWRVSSPTQAVIDELHIREFTESASSGVSAANRGKYLGVIQANTTDPNTGTATGLNYLQNEGFNYVQLMPLAQFNAVPETGIATTNQPNIFGWGYDPVNYNVPEGEYSSDSVNPLTRINEMKQMVQGLHNAGIGVIMDVVYNHVENQATSVFEETEPGYYFRNSDGSYCGNDTASDHEMFQKYILDSVAYWVKNYDIDGFRFDMMANIDTATINKVRAELTAIDPNIMTYGEGWSTSTDLATSNSSVEQTTEGNALSVSGVGFFDDATRTSIRGEGGNSAFVDESGNMENTVARAITASGGLGSLPALESFGTPSQAINYVECHDGFTLNDQLWMNHQTDSVATHDNRDELANAINILSEGVTFMESGQEFDQTKLVNPVTGAQVTASSVVNTMSSNDWLSPTWNSTNNAFNGVSWNEAKNSYDGVINYNGTTYYDGDAVNSINWDLVKTNQTQDSFIQSLIKFKEANPSFWPNDYSKIYGGLITIDNAASGSGVVTYTMTSGTTKYIVILNASGKAITVGTGGSYYSTTNLTSAYLTLSSDSNFTVTGKPIGGSNITVQDLTATIVKIS